MNHDVSRTPVLDELYQQFLVDDDVPAYVHRTMQRYTAATLGRLVEMGARTVRRAAVLVLGHVGDYDSNHMLGRALTDADRGVRLAAETAIRFVWCRAGSPAQRQKLARLIALNRTNDFLAVLREATALIREAPWLAEIWNQRAIAHFGLAHYGPSIQDCRQALEINAYHFGAAAGMGQCYLRQGDQLQALESFRRALALNPELEGIRANIQYLERTLKRKR
jgi:tetratricopeptide (TPR) repeat protein